jgi:hypothetical protein
MAGGAGAQTLQLRGSDTLFTFTNDLIDICEPNITSSELVYRGGGSTLGETEMETGNQQIAPMSRFIDSGSCTLSRAATFTCTTDGINNDGDGATDEAGELCGTGGQGCKVALDGIAAFADSAEANTCNTLRYTGFMEVLDQNGTAGLDNGAGGPCPGCVDGPDADGVLDHYEFTDWRDVLRIVYGGQHTHKTADACAEAPPSRSPIAEKFCNSDVRNTLVNSWGNLFEEGAGCMGADPDACTQLKHAFRRDDVSGTTDVFLELLALPAITTQPFCNGAEMQDEDPIRRDCAEDMTQPANTPGTNGYEQVCNSVARSLLGASANGFQTPFGTNMNPGWRGGPTMNPPNAESADLSLVLPLVVPPIDPFHDINGCSALGVGGQFRYAPMPLGGISAAQLRCPDGNARVGGQCQWPARQVSGVFRFGCINKKGNLPGARSVANMDGRVYNLIPRNPDGTIQTVPRVDAADVAGGQPEYQVQVHHAFYRIHGTAVMPNGTPDTGSTGCRLPDATEQIGCLVHASPCSLGFAGLAADLLEPNKPLAMRAPNAAGGAVPPTEDNIRRLNDPTGAGTACAASGDYDIRFPLARNLWINALKGFESVGDPDADYDNIADTRREQDLLRCACDRFFADQSATAAGFITLSALGAGQCDTAGEGGICTTVPRTCP